MLYVELQIDAQAALLMLRYKLQRLYVCIGLLLLMDPAVILTDCHTCNASGTWNLIGDTSSFGFAKQRHQDAIALPLPMLHKPLMTPVQCI